MATTTISADAINPDIGVRAPALSFTNDCDIPPLTGKAPSTDSVFLPTFGTIVAAIAFDQTGTTRIGTFILKHSFMRAGLVATIFSGADRAGYVPARALTRPARSRIRPLVRANFVKIRFVRAEVLCHTI